MVEFEMLRSAGVGGGVGRGLVGDVAQEVASLNVHEDELECRILEW